MERARRVGEGDVVGLGEDEERAQDGRDDQVMAIDLPAPVPQRLGIEQKRHREEERDRYPGRRWNRRCRILHVLRLHLTRAERARAITDGVYLEKSCNRPLARAWILIVGRS